MPKQNTERKWTAMKNIILKSGRSLTLQESRALVRNVKKVWPSVQSDDHRAPHGYPTPVLAERANLRAIIEAHEGYITVFSGSEDCGFAGYKALFIGFKSLPDNFQNYFPNYLIVEK